VWGAGVGLMCLSVPLSHSSLRGRSEPQQKRLKAHRGTHGTTRLQHRRTRPPGRLGRNALSMKSIAFNFLSFFCVCVSRVCVCVCVCVCVRKRVRVSMRVCGQAAVLILSVKQIHRKSVTVALWDALADSYGVSHLHMKQQQNCNIGFWEVIRQSVAWSIDSKKKQKRESEEEKK